MDLHLHNEPGAVCYISDESFSFTSLQSDKLVGDLFLQQRHLYYIINRARSGLA